MMINIIRFIILVVFKLTFRVRITGRENVPAKGAALLCANHVGELDMLFIGYRIKRLVRWMAKEQLFKNPVFASLIKWLGAFPVKRGTGDVGAMKTVFKLLKDGHIVGIYPEGTRMKHAKSREVSVKPGAAMIAIKTGVPILPVALKGEGRIFGRIEVIFGKPFYLETEKDKKYTNEEMVEMTKDIMKKVYSLMGDK